VVAVVDTGWAGGRRESDASMPPWMRCVAGCGNLYFSQLLWAAGPAHPIRLACVCGVRLPLVTVSGCFPVDPVRSPRFAAMSFEPRIVRQVHRYRRAGQPPTFAPQVAECCPTNEVAPR
jgi:hypothetical protein